MYKIILVASTMFLSLITGNVAAQDNTNSPARPDIPGNLLFDLGFNTLQNNDVEGFETGIWGSKVVNIYYMYEHRVGESNFFILPGFGLGLDKYKFEDNMTLTTIASNPDTTRLTALSALLPEGSDVKKTKLAANYFDIPLEIRFYANPNNRNSFKVGIGGKIGVLYSAHTKVKYEWDDTSRKIKDKQYYNLNRFRYGVNARVGFSSFNLFAYYALNELFANGKGPGATEMNTLSFGLTINGF